MNFPKVRSGEETPWDEDNEVRTPDNVTLYQVHGLNPFTTYSFRVRAVTATGIKSKPSESSFYMFTLREGNFTTFNYLDLVLKLGEILRFVESLVNWLLSALQTKRKSFRVRGN